MNELEIDPEKLREEGNSVWRSVQVEPTILDEDERRVRGVISTDQIDAYNTIVDPGGARVSGYMNYASVLFNHDSSLLIGNADQVVRHENSVEAEWRFLPEGVSDLADRVWKLYKDGWLNGYSIGFVPLEWEDDTVDGMDIVRFLEWEMKEFSLTSVPANAGAMARNSEAMETFRDLQERGSSSFFLNFNSLERERDNSNGISTTLSDSSGTGQWDLSTKQEKKDEPALRLVRTVPSYQDHPIADVDEWDESRARDQIASWAGGPDKEDIDWDKFKKGFFWYNESESENKTAYSYPYVYIIDGEPKAADKGIYAVASYLDQGDIPDDAKSTIRNQLEKYYDKMDETAPWNEDNTENKLEVSNMTDEEKEELRELVGEVFDKRISELTSEEDDSEEIEDRLAEIRNDAEDAWAKADMAEEDIEELREEVSELTKAVNKILDHLS